MEQGQPSRTALIVAAHRAAHQIFESGRIFADPLARTLLGDGCEAVIEEVAGPSQRLMRLMVAARSRFAEECLSTAVRRGARQAVILGAGLDTFSLRNPYAGLGLRVFEVDHPATQTWKRERLAQSGLATPRWLTFAPVDFQREKLADALVSSGFLPDQPTFYQWLGVVHYLDRRAVLDTLGYIAQTPESEVVFDYSEPLDNYSPEMRVVIDALIAHASALGEPFQCYFEPDDLHRELKALGFDDVEDLGFSEIAVRFLGATEDEAKGGPRAHLIRARRVD